MTSRGNIRCRLPAAQNGGVSKTTPSSSKLLGFMQNFNQTSCQSLWKGEWMEVKERNNCLHAFMSVFVLRERTTAGKRKNEWRWFTANLGAFLLLSLQTRVCNPRCTFMHVSARRHFAHHLNAEPPGVLLSSQLNPPSTPSFPPSSHFLPSRSQHAPAAARLWSTARLLCVFSCLFI